MVKWTRDDNWYPRATETSAGTNGTPHTHPAPRTTATVPPTADANAAPAATGERESRRPRRSVFVADTLRPRAVHHLDARARDVQLQGRTLWLSLHGEAHFRSLRVRDPVTEDEVAALARTRKEAVGSAGGAGGAAPASGVRHAAPARSGQEVRIVFF